MMKNFKFAVLLLSLLFGASVYAGAQTQEKKNALERLDSLREAHPLKVSIGAEVVSSYVYRGIYQAGASIQPKFSLNYKGLIFEAWGSTGFAKNDLKEVDLVLGYQYKGLKIILTDYFVPGMNPGYFVFDSHETSHSGGPMISWTITEKVPITVAWETLLWGRDYKNFGDGNPDNDKRQFTSYFQISYPFRILKYIDCEAGAGAYPWSSEIAGTEGFAVTNVYLNTSKIWKLDFGMKLGVNLRAAYNPAFNRFNLVGGLYIGL